MCSSCSLLIDLLLCCLHPMASIVGWISMQRQDRHTHPLRAWSEGSPPLTVAWPSTPEKKNKGRRARCAGVRRMGCARVGHSPCQTQINKSRALYVLPVPSSVLCAERGGRGDQWMVDRRITIRWKVGKKGDRPPPESNQVAGRTGCGFARAVQILAGASRACRNRTRPSIGDKWYLSQPLNWAGRAVVVSASVGNCWTWTCACCLRLKRITYMVTTAVRIPTTQPVASLPIDGRRAKVRVSRRG